jgi:hypothetical protein
MNLQTINIILTLLREVVYAYKEAKQRNELERIKDNPGKYLAERYGRMRDSAETGANVYKPSDNE